jgi:hypothetical protein
MLQALKTMRIESLNAQNKILFGHILTVLLAVDLNIFCFDLNSMMIAC